MKSSVGFAGILLVLLCFPGVGASATDSKEEKAPAAKTKTWSLSVKGGLTLNAGNTESKLITGGVNFKLNAKAFEYLTNIEGFYGTGQNEVNVSKGKWDNKITRSSKKRLNLYATMAMEYDKFAQIAFRGNAGLGARYTLANTPKTGSYLAAGINGEFTDVFDALVEVANVSSMRFNLNYLLQKTLSPTGKYSFDVLYTSDLLDFFRDYRVEIRANMTLLIKNPISLKIEVQEKYTNRPVEENLKKNDFILVTALEISL